MWMGSLGLVDQLEQEPIGLLAAGDQLDLVPQRRRWDAERLEDPLGGSPEVSEGADAERW